MRHKIYSLFISLAFSTTSFAQLDSIQDQNSWRSFIVHLPSGYSSNNQYPLVINLHGLNSNAAQQQNYSQFDLVADTANFIVVYPNAIGGSWVINGSSDADFIAHLIDTIRSEYSCNSCLFITGMSQGGFLTYKLACALNQEIKAIAVVSGNMSQNLQNTCSISSDLPVMHFHGTTDPLVAYTGTIGIPPVETTIDWWVNQTNCNPTPQFTAIPDVVQSDSSTVEKYYYANGATTSEVTFYKVLNGGHTWPGASPIPQFGNTNQDLDASSIIGDFFLQFCSSSLEINERDDTTSISVYPNPFDHSLTIELDNHTDGFIVLYDLFGRNVFTHSLSGSTTLQTIDLKKGIYVYRVISEGQVETTGKLIKE